MNNFKRIWMYVALMAVGLTPAAAQVGPGPFAYFPTADVADARMLSFGCVGIDTFEQRLSMTVAVPPSESSFVLSVFDGDTGRGGGSGHWDLGNRQLLYELYADPLATGNTAPADLVGMWTGNDPNPTSGPGWSADAATMPDNGWWNLTVTTSPSAQAPSGNYFYHLVISEDGTCTGAEQLASDLKVAASAPMTFLTSRFGFEASMRNIAADGPIVYPGWDLTLPNIFFFLDSPTTYDGTFEFFLNVPFAQTELTIFDGDFDRGAVVLQGLPSGVPLDACSDSDDPNTQAMYAGFPADFFPPGFDIAAAIAAGGLKAEGANTPGSPADDNYFDIFRRGEIGDDNARGCVRYEVTDPNGVVYRNDNPSGNLEWEEFRLASQLDPNPGDADIVVATDTLPAGVWKVKIIGLDLSNLNFWRMDTLCAIREGLPACPPPVYVVGDTVWLDTNGNGVQDAGEPGIPGVVVELIGDSSMPPLATRMTGDTSAPNWSDCVNNNTGLDTDGLYCFGVNEPGSYTVVIAPENFAPGGALSGLASTTGGESQSDTVVDGNVLTYDFGYRAAGVIGDRVWLDANGDGVQDGGEAGINGVTVTLLDAGGNVVGTRVTSGDGNYLFENLPAGGYTVVVDGATLPPTYDQTYDLDGLGTPDRASLTLGPGETRLDVDFGYRPPASIGDRVWLDTDGDGVQDSGEAGINGVTVILLDGSGTPITSQVTAGDGLYLFTDLPPGSFTVVVDETTLPPGLAQTFDLDGLGTPNRAAATLALGQDRRDVDFGYTPCAACDGKVSTLSLRYDGNTPADVRIEQDNGDVVFESGPTSCGFSCSKPISALSMIWNGTQPVRIKAWKGTVGSTLLADVDNIAVGQEVTVTGYAGSPNDVYWELFAAGTSSKLGESSFHLSCSDSEMNGAEDCGNAEGNGKANSSSLINDWLFEGMVDSDETLDCSPGPSATAVQPGEVITFSGTDNGTFGNEIRIFVGCEEATLHTSCSQPIGPGQIVGDFTVVAGGSEKGGALCPLNVCSPATVGTLDFHDREVRWTIRNDGDLPLTIDRLDLTWPLRNSYLEEVKREGDIIANEHRLPPTTIFESPWSTDANKRTIKAGETDVLKFKFHDVASAGGLYDFLVDFGGGCSLAIGSDQPCTGGGAFACSKPIDALTMIWNGTQPVRVKAWKGSVGSTLLADVDNIAVGSEFTVTGFAGSPNDVFWELFAAGTDTKLGESSFHLSCSDDEMNGAEDCGNPEGNGKANSSSLINDWIFEGMVDSDETLDCTPPATPPGDDGCDEGVCMPSAATTAELHDKELRWEITNAGAFDLTIKRISITWPAANGYLDEIKREGDQIFAGDAAAPSADITTGWHPDANKRTIGPGETDVLKFKFQNDAASGDYAVEVEFAGGCTVSIQVTGGGGTPVSFTCSKPIDALTMRWDGGQAVRVKAWKGSVGSTLLADVPSVAVGSELTVTGFAGSPNDVIWELFAANSSSKLGESSFHLSCSDSEMNGAEDCGNREGDGKANSSGLINDWIFEGMVDSDETLDCTPGGPTS